MGNLLRVLVFAGWSASRSLALLVFVISTNLVAQDEPPIPIPIRTIIPEEATISITTMLPYGAPPISYFDPNADHAVAALQKRLEAGDTRLEADETLGYLSAVLRELKIPRESQLLVFSRTSVNKRLITPRNPRAIYFNDETSVGYVPGAEYLEISATDPHKGAMFYIIRQPEPGDSTDQRSPAIRREARCIACHVSDLTLFTPGHMVKSYLTDERGEPRSGYSRVTHATELHKRMGGWYVTGRFGQQTHLGNLIGEEDEARQKEEPGFAGSWASVSAKLDASKYPTPHSDAVAHLVLQHQMHGQNLLTRTRFEWEFRRRSNAEAELVKYLLMAEEAPFDDAVSGSTKFADWFTSQGPFDSQGRSLRQLDLKTRLFRFGVSPLIYSRQFAAYPAQLRARILSAIAAALLGESHTLEERDANDREAALQILAETIADFPTVP